MKATSAELVTLPDFVRDTTAAGPALTPIPRAARNCFNCDSLHRNPDGSTECRLGPLQTVFIGIFPKENASPVLLAKPGQQQAMVPGEPKFMHVSRPAYPHYWCREWQQMHPDHPSLQPQATHAGPEKAQ